MSIGMAKKLDCHTSRHAPDVMLRCTACTVSNERRPLGNAYPWVVGKK
jgi:hypothetical protein